jgi:sulfite exporter TauE/SafE
MDNNGNVLSILFADFNDYVPNHLLHCIAMIGVLVPTTKDSIDNQSSPIHLQRLKTLFLLVGRLNSVAALGIIIVHHHGIDT